MDPSLSVAQIDEVIQINRLYRSLWWIALAANLGVFLVEFFRFLLFPEDPTSSPSAYGVNGQYASSNLSLVSICILGAYRCTMCWVAYRMTRMARPWWGLSRFSPAVAAALGFGLAALLLLAAGLGMWLWARGMSWPGGFFGIKESSLLAMRQAAERSAAAVPAANCQPAASQPPPAPTMADLAQPSVSVGRERTWLDRVNEYCARIGIPTRWHHFHPEALAYGVLCGMSPEDFLKRGYNKRLADLPEGSRALGKALADQLESRIRTEFGLKRAD